MALGSGLPLTGLPWMSAAIAAAALLLTLWGTRRHGRRAVTLAGQAGGEALPLRSNA